MKKTNYYKYIWLFVILLMLGCQKENEVVIEQEIIESSDIQNATDFENDVFVDGVNQTFLEETGMTVEELEKMVAEEVEQGKAKFEQELEKQAKNFILNNDAAKGGFTYDKNELAGAIGYLLWDIKQNAKKYFAASISSQSNNLTLKLGLSEQLLKNAVAKFPALRKHSNKQKVDLYGFSLESITTSGGTNVIIKFKGNARYRHYIKFFGKYRRVLDRRGSAHVELPLHFNTAANKIEAGTLKVSKIKIKNKFIDIVFLFKSTIIKLIINKFVVIKKNIDMDISYNFISKVYVNFDAIYKSSGKIFFQFKIKNPTVVNTIKDLLKLVGIIL